MSFNYSIKHAGLQLEKYFGSFQFMYIYELAKIELFQKIESNVSIINSESFPFHTLILLQLSSTFCDVESALNLSTLKIEIVFT